MNQATGAWIAPGDPRWERVLRNLSHDIYHLPQYVSVAARHAGGEPTAFLWMSDGRPFLLPLVLGRLPTALGAPSEWRDAASPYGYPSPLVPGDAGETEIAAFLRAFAAAARERELISGFIRLHPLLHLPEAPLREAGLVVHHGATVYMDLQEPELLTWRGMVPEVARGIRKLMREGFTTAIDAWEEYGEFRALYRETMARVGATESYHFSDAYFDDLRRELGDRVHLCTVRAPGGEIAAAALFFTTGNLMQGHLNGTRNTCLGRSPTRLINHATRLWGRERGYRFMHLGGGVGGAADSLFRFKAGFSGHRAQFCTLRLVFHPERYQWLNQRAGNPAPDPAARFPAYRTALVSVIPAAG